MREWAFKKLVGAQNYFCGLLFAHNIFSFSKKNKPYCYKQSSSIFPYARGAARYKIKLYKSIAVISREQRFNCSGLKTVEIQEIYLIEKVFLFTNNITLLHMRNLVFFSICNLFC